MASVKVAVRVRPFDEREKSLTSKKIVDMVGRKTKIIDKMNPHKYKEFSFDFSHWSFDNTRELITQDRVFRDLGQDVVHSAFQGYNACVFAYGQTGSGKTYTMMGTTENPGLIPRICEALFSQLKLGLSYKIEVSYLEIYNEKVKDLLNPKSGSNLKIRENPLLGPVINQLSKHIVTDFIHIQHLIGKGNLNRKTASTNMNSKSSRSHAIFTITFVEADICNDLPKETVSKINLVDLAGSEKAEASGGMNERLKEGAHINKSLVTLGCVISALSSSSRWNDQYKHIPYRNSVLTWLLKDSLGGNSKTIMIAAISPADSNYSETMSTLRYANRAKSIINTPTINEDPNAKLIRELRTEIMRLKCLISVKYVDKENHILEKELNQKEEEEKLLTGKWEKKWQEMQHILQEQGALALRKFGTGVILDSEKPHLICINDNMLSTGVTLYHLEDGETSIGTRDAQEKQHITLSHEGMCSEHCSILLRNGEATLMPKGKALCWVNGQQVESPTVLFQGCLIMLGHTNIFRYNDPAQAKKMRQECDFDSNQSSLSSSQFSILSWSTTELNEGTNSFLNLISLTKTESNGVEQTMGSTHEEGKSAYFESSSGNEEIQMIGTSRLLAMENLVRMDESERLDGYHLNDSLPISVHSSMKKGCEHIHIHIPGFVLRGSGLREHYEYEIVINAGNDEWTILRRYSRFRQLHFQMKRTYGSKVEQLEFPPRRPFMRLSECLAKERKCKLENYLQQLFEICCGIVECPLNQIYVTKESIQMFSSFFLRGMFECGKHGTS